MTVFTAVEVTVVLGVATPMQRHALDRSVGLNVARVAGVSRSLSAAFLLLLTSGSVAGSTVMGPIGWSRQLDVSVVLRQISMDLPLSFDG